MKYKNIKKVGLCIVAFEGTEHLCNIISELRDLVDYVSIGYQMTSYHGDPIDQTDLKEIYRLKDEDKLVDNLLCIVTDSEQKPRVQETEKRNKIIQDAEDHGCSHCIVIDSDEFYDHDAFKRALKDIDKNDYEITYCEYENYYHDYNHYLVYPFKQGKFVPFVSKVKYRHTYDCVDFPYPSDPTRRYVRPYDREYIVTDPSTGKRYKQRHYTVDYHCFKKDEVMMHHLSWIRNDIPKKLFNWSAKKVFENYEVLISKAVACYNNFDEDSDECQVSLLFNTPNNSLTCKKFEKTLIHPKFDISTRAPKVKNDKRLLVVNLSSSTTENHLFKKLDEACRQTWAKGILNGTYKDVDYWTIVDCPSEFEAHFDLPNKYIYVPTLTNGTSNINQLLYRFIAGVDMLRKNGIDFDYIVRTNTSTWINIPLVQEIIGRESDYKKVYSSRLYSAFWSTFHLYLSGNCIVMSKYCYDELNYVYTQRHLENIKDVMDDTLISSVYYSYCMSLGIPEYEREATMDGANLIKPLAETNFDELDFSVPVFQIKTFNNATYEEREQNDIPKMIGVDKAYNSAKRNVEDLYWQYKKNHDNKICWVIPYNKFECARMSPEEKLDMQFNNPMPLMDAYKLSQELYNDNYIKQNQ